MDDRMYHAFLRVEREHWWFRARREMLSDLVEQWIPSGGAVLDIGCGTGCFLEGLSSKYVVYGVDPSPIAVEMGRSRGLKTVYLGSVEDLDSVRGQQFDLVSLLDVIEHVDADLAGIRRAAQMLRPGGRLLVTVPAYQFLWSYHDVRNHHRRRYLQADVERLLIEGGLKDVRVGGFNTFLFPLALTIRTYRQLTGRYPEDEFEMPRPWINELLYRIFKSEQGWLSRSRGFPVGLSIMGVGTFQGPVDSKSVSSVEL